MPINQTWECNLCKMELSNKQEYIAHLEAHKRPSPPAQPTPQPVPQVQPRVSKPVQLTYVYNGECTACFAPVTTLEIDVASKHFVIAHCVKCNKQISQREVDKL